MKKVIQPNTRKVYGTTQQESQMNAVRKIHNLLSSGAVTVTGPTHPRILKQKFVGNTITEHQNIQQSTMINTVTRCYVCDEPAGANCTILSEASTTNSQTKLPNKIGQIVGDAFLVIVSVDDVLCKRCTTMINHVDRLETDIERVKTNILNYLYKKYGLSTDEDDRRPQISGNNVSTINSSAVVTATLSPPPKMQKLSVGNVVNRRIINNNNEDDNNQVTRKINVNLQNNRDPIDNQLSTLFEGSGAETKITTHTSAVQQMKIISPQQQQPPIKKGPIKIYKCMSCEFKTTDLKQFQPHYEICKQNSQTCKFCKKQFTSLSALKLHVSEKHPTEYSCPVCYTKFSNEMTLKKHLEINHPDVKPVIEPSATQLYACNICHYMTSDKPNYEEHMRKHVKVKPFKCRLCSTRFETREQASIHAKSHQPNYFKCGTCSASFTQREALVKHFEVHQQQQTQQTQPTQQKSQPQSLTTQKLLQETIDEALRESDHVEAKGIHFFSCNICSLTFIQEHYYNQHMETHKKEGKKAITIVSTSFDAGDQQTPSTTVASVVSTAGAAINTTSSQSLIRQEVRNTNLLTTISGTTQSSTSGNANSSITTVSAISEADIESIFEKMHSDKNDNEAGAASTGKSSTGENLVITSQENAVGGITFNITIPQPENSQDKKTNENNDEKLSAGENISVGISMPVLDQPDESLHLQQQNMDENNTNLVHSSKSNDQDVENRRDNQQDVSQESTSNSSTLPVSMPSLDDDGEGTESAAQQQIDQEQHDEQQQQQQQEQQQHEQEEHHEQQHHQVINSEHVSMELEEMQNSVESGQIKFILNENGQILQLDNHIITTDADGNQILVEGTDSEQIQQLLQSVGVLQSGGSLVDGETLQMIQGENNQMIIVQQGEDGHQLIDASLLNADGHIVIQQAQNDNVDMHDGSHHHEHTVDDNGVSIPVEYTADGHQIVQTTDEHQHHQDNMEQQMQQDDETEHEHLERQNEGIEDDGNKTSGQTTITTQSLTQSQNVVASGGNGTEEFFALDDLKI